MKKLLMILLGAMLVLSMAGSAVAAEGDPHTVRTSDSVETTVTLGLSELFEVTLPSLIELDYDEAHDSFVGKATFSIDIIRLASGNELKISVDSLDKDGNGFYMKSADQSSTIHYKIGWGLAGQHVPNDGQSGNSYATVISPGNTFISTAEDRGLTQNEELYIHAKVDIEDTEGISVTDATYTGILTFEVTTGQP